MKMIKLGLLAALSGVVMCTTAMAQETVKFVNIGHGYFSGPLYVAVREKLFEKYGLKAEVISVKGGSLAFTAVFGEDADFGILSYEHVLAGAAQGRNVVSIFNLADRPHNNIVVNNELYEANKDKSLAERVAALKGHRVGVPSAGGTGEKMLGVLAREYGLKLPGDVELAYLGGNPAAYVGAFRSKVIDAAMPFEPAGVLMEQEGLGNTLVNLMSGEVEAFRDLIFITVNTYPEMLTKNPELVRKVAAVFAEAQGILLDPVRGKAIMAAEFPNLTPAANEKAYETVSQMWTNNGHMSIEAAKKVFSYLRPKGTMEIDYDKTFTNDFLEK